MDSTCPCCAPPWDLEIRRITGFFTVKVYDLFGNLLWIGDQGTDTTTGVAIDSSGNVYTSGLALGTSSFNILEKRDPDGSLTASVPWSSSGADGVAVNSSGVYLLMEDASVDKYDFDLNLVGTLPESNGFVSFTAVTEFHKIAAIGDLVTVTARTGGSTFTIAVWEADALINITAPNRTGTLSGLEIDGTNIFTSVSSTSSNSFTTWETTGAIVSSNGGAAISAMGINGSSIFGTYGGSTPITGLVQKINGGNPIGANAAGYYAGSVPGSLGGFPPVNIPTKIKLYIPSDVLQWSNDWSTDPNDRIAEIVTSSNRVYAVGNRGQAT